MIQLSFAAMGTTVLLRGRSRTLLNQACDVFDDVEAVCSRFRADSELNRLNASRDQAEAVSPILAEALEAARTARTLSDGLVDAAVGANVAAWGYDRTFDDVTDLRTPPAVLGPVSRWDIRDRVVTRPPGLMLDLGGTAKGWTCDRVVDRNLAVVVNAGGDIRSNDPGLAVDLEDPDGTTYAGVHLGIGALATSSTRRRAWRVAGAPAHHLVDPRTGSPAESPIISASAIADTALLAETAAKTTLLLGEEGLAWAARQQWVRGAIVWWRDGGVYATAGVTAA